MLRQKSIQNNLPVKPTMHGWLLASIMLFSLICATQANAADTTIKGTGATSATAGLEVTNSSDTTLLYVRNDGNVGIGKTRLDYTLTVSGTAWCTSGAWSGSDLRWKENIKTLPDETLNKVLKLSGVSFDWF